MNYIENLKQYSLPNKNQIEDFIEFLFNHHSWYKHLNLIKGNLFVIYIEDNIQYGNLNYVWENEIENLKIPKYYKSKWSFNLFPYCHYEFEEAFSLHKEHINDCTTNKKDLIKWAKLITERDYLWNNLSKEERNIIVKYDDNDLKNHKSNQVHHYLKIEDEIYKIQEILRDKEKEKVRKVIDRIIQDINNYE